MRRFYCQMLSINDLEELLDSVKKKHGDGVQLSLDLFSGELFIDITLEQMINLDNHDIRKDGKIIVLPDKPTKKELLEKTPLRETGVVHIFEQYSKSNTNSTHDISLDNYTY